MNSVFLLLLHACCRRLSGGVPTYIRTTYMRSQTLEMDVFVSERNCQAGQQLSCANTYQLDFCMAAF